MTTYISLLRGINVSGQKLIKMVDLKVLYEELGFVSVKTYIQSGNVVFQSDIKELNYEKTIADKIYEKYNFEVPVLVKTLSEWSKITNNNPFSSNNLEENKLYVTLLSDVPDSSLVEKINSGNYGNDQFICDNNVVYLFFPELGYGNTKLSNNFFESKLKLKATTRNWTTMINLLKIATEM